MRWWYIYLSNDLPIYTIYGGESFDLKKNNIPLKKPVDSGKTFFDISVNTSQICMRFETATPEK